MPLLRALGYRARLAWDSHARCRTLTPASGERCEGTRAHLFRHHIHRAYWTDVW